MKKYSEFLKFYQKEALFTNYKVQNNRLFEATDSFSNGIGFAESLVGRAINGLFSMFGKNVNKRRLASYRKDLENEYLAGVVRACIANNMSSNEITNAEDKYINWVMSIKQPNKLTCWNVNIEGFKPFIEFDAPGLPETQYIKIELFKGDKSVTVIEEKTLTRVFPWEKMGEDVKDGNDYKVRVTVYNNDGTKVSDMFVESDNFVISTTKDPKEFIKYVKENFQEKWELESQESEAKKSSETSEKDEKTKTEPSKDARETTSKDKNQHDKTKTTDKTETTNKPEASVVEPEFNKKQNENTEKINNLKECLKKKNDTESQKKFYSEIADLRVKYKNNPNFNKKYKSQKTGKEFTGSSLIDEIMSKTQEGQFQNLSDNEINTILKKLEFIYSLTKKDTLVKKESTIHRYFEFLLEKELNLLSEEVTAGEEVTTVPKKNTAVATIPKETETGQPQNNEEESELSELARKKVIAENKITPKYKEFESKGEVGPKISAMGSGKGETIQTLLGDNINHKVKLEKDEHYKQWANIKLDELDSMKLAESFNKNPDLKKKATDSVNTQGVALIQLSAERLFKKSEKYEGKTSGDYYPNVRQNFIVKPRDKEILETIWRQHVLRVKGMFRDYLDMNVLDPATLLNNEKKLPEKLDNNIATKTDIRLNNDESSGTGKELEPDDRKIIGILEDPNIKTDYGIILVNGIGVLVYKFKSKMPDYSKVVYYKFCGLVDIKKIFEFIKTEKDEEKIKAKIEELKYLKGKTDMDPRMEPLYKRFRFLRDNQEDNDKIISAIFSVGLSRINKNLLICQYNNLGGAENWKPYVIVTNFKQRPIELATPEEALNLNLKQRVYNTEGMIFYNLDFNKKNMWGLDKVGTTIVHDETRRNKIIDKFTDRIAKVYKIDPKHKDIGLK